MSDFLANQIVTLNSESGFTPIRNTALSNTPIAVKSTAGSLMGWSFINVNNVAVYVKFYNVVAGSVVVGTTPVLLTICVPPGTSDNPGFHFQEPDIIPIEVFSTAISMACITGLADSSTTAPSTPIHASVRIK